MSPGVSKSVALKGSMFRYDSKKDEGGGEKQREGSGVGALGLGNECEVKGEGLEVWM